LVNTTRIYPDFKGTQNLHLQARVYYFGLLSGLLDPEEKGATILEEIATLCKYMLRTNPEDLILSTRRFESLNYGVLFYL
jgi:hypothetical protein